ncbi:hypothetical protein [Actinomadura fibrosa]|uniref:DUF3307 domain-containing protein n=1 Tax=Actinomadura fibrosa TaxID=111802 RepID=A0ABW2X9S5_9ACTN|nr:hypothetical protein [Actinomadura fibrosa]
MRDRVRPREQRHPAATTAVVIALSALAAALAAFQPLLAQIAAFALSVGASAHTAADLALRLTDRRPPNEEDH